ncbi:disease resistance CC-NBS-LRR class family protein [Tanacetum coccineum]
MDKLAPCSSCSLGKLIARPTPLKVKKESPVFLERIQGDIYGSIHPPCGLFRYFMVLIDASSKWSHVSLLSTRSVAFAKFLAQIIKLRAHFPDYIVKRVRLDNAGEFTSQAFNDYCMSVGIVVEHPVAYVYTQNGLAESLIKRLQLIARQLIIRTKLPVSIWVHAILHAASLIHMRPIYVPIAPPQQTKMGPQRRLRIYVEYETICIIRYLEPLTGDVFTTRFADCHFNEEIFPSLGEEKKNHEKDVSWSKPSLLYLDSHTKQSETKVQKIMHMQEITNQLPDAFTDTKRATKSYIPVVNAPARVEILDVKSDDKVTQDSKACLKRGRPVGSKDKNHRKRKITENAIIHEDIVLEGTQNVALPEEEIDDINKVVSINYGHSKISLDQIEIEIIDEKFCYNVACDIMNGNDDPEPTSIIECQIVKPVRYRWVFIQKQNENEEVIRYKARLVAQGFSQRPGIDYEETYSPVMDAIMFRYLISLAVSENLDMRLMDVVTAYLYRSLDSDIYMKILEGFKMPEALSAKPKDTYSVELQRSLYGLKQSGRMWKVLRGLHPKWRANVTILKIERLVKSIVLKAKKESSDDETLTSESDDEE